jgi:fibronectin type 3 domain-containing protein
MNFPVRHLLFISRCFLLLVPFLLIISCGKKGPPTLKAYEKPPAPSGLVAYHREDRMVLTWSFPDGLRSSLQDFQVLRSEKDGFEKIGEVNSSLSSFTDETFKIDVTCNYKVVARNLKGVLSDDSNIITVTPRAVPATPSEILFSVKADSVALSWKSSGEEICYNVYKTVEKGKYGAPLNRKPVCATSFTDGAVSLERPVYYTVTALRDSDVRDEGASSEEGEVNPSQYIPSPPSDLRVVKGEKTYLIWKESPETWVRGYRVYRKKEGEKEFTPLAEVRLPTFTLSEKVDRKAWYMIRALGPLTESEPLIGEVK